MLLAKMTEDMFYNLIFTVVLIYVVMQESTK